MEESMGKLLSVIHRNLRSYLDFELAEMDIGHGPRCFLVEITLHEGLSQEELSRCLLMDKTTTARAVKRLEDLGYVVRTRDPVDSRQNHLYPTKKALEYFPVILQAGEKAKAALVEGFTDGEKAQLLAFLDRVADNALQLRQRGQSR